MNAENVKKAHEKHTEYLRAVEMRAYLWALGDDAVDVTIGGKTKYDQPYRMYMSARIIVDVLSAKVAALKAELEALGVKL